MLIELVRWKVKLKRIFFGELQCVNKKRRDVSDLSLIRFHHIDSDRN
jgi:hypothetical protein